MAEEVDGFGRSRPRRYAPNQKPGREVRYAAEAFILPSLGKTKLDELTADQVRKWHAGLAKARARVRTAKGATQQFSDDESDPDRVRRRKSTACRILTILKAALNRF
jgi:hypothetical protein